MSADVAIALGAPTEVRMSDMAWLTATEIARHIRDGNASCEEILTACLRTIADDDGRIRAWAAVGENEALTTARRLDRLDREVAASLPLLGVPVGVKDVFDTFDLPTAYGSPIYRGYQPAADAALVVMLREAGAILVGKTKTAEFATTHPADTRNPIDPRRTPGGSSSGSAAAVACGMVPLAVGTQTGGSVVRPASYCRVFGLKPTFGVLPLAGALPIASSLDTAGLFARSTDDVALALAALSRNRASHASARCSRPLGSETGSADSRAPRLGFTRWGWELLESIARSRIDDYVTAVAAAGLEVDEIDLPASLEEVVLAQRTIERVEIAAALGNELDRAPDAVSQELTAIITSGRAVDRETYLSARRFADEERWRHQAALMPFDAVIAASTLGVPPMGLASTGDPMLCRPWSLFGMPSLATPGPLTDDGLPIGIQLVGAIGTDQRVLSATAKLPQVAAPRHPPQGP